MRLGSADIVDVLLRAGVEPDSEALVWAVQDGNPGIVDALLQAGAEPDSEALVWAVQEGHPYFVDDFVDALLQAGAEPDSAALRSAVARGNADIVDAFLQAGGDFCEAAELEAPCITVRTPIGCGSDCADALVERLKTRLGPDAFAGLKAWGDTECVNSEGRRVDCRDFRPGCIDGLDWQQYYQYRRFVTRAAGDGYHETALCVRSRYDPGYKGPKRMPGMFYVRANEQRAAD